VNEGGQAIVADNIRQHQNRLASDGLEALGKPLTTGRSEKP
jgi:hypothetical protein